MVNPAGDVAEIGIIPNQRVQGKSFIVWSCAPRRKAAGFLFIRSSLMLSFVICVWRALLCGKNGNRIVPVCSFRAFRELCEEPLERLQPCYTYEVICVSTYISKEVLHGLPVPV